MTATARPHLEAGTRRAEPPPRRRRSTVLLVEVAVLVAVAGLAAEQAPGFAKDVGTSFARLARPDGAGLVVAVACEAVSLVTFAQVPRWLLRRTGVWLGRGDALALMTAANGMAIILPAGTVSSSVWSAHQYTRRGARLPQATWVVMAAGFASSVTLIAVGVAGAGLAGVVPAAVAVAVGLAFVAGSSGFVVLVHRLGGKAVPAVSGSRLRSAVARLDAVLSEAAAQRAGWGVGAAVLGGSAVNWLADAGCLTAAFLVLRYPVPWNAVLLAYAAGQLAGAAVPLPGGFGVVEGGTVGVLVALGMAGGPAVAVVAVYRLIGYWAPVALAAPAYGWARRRPA